MKNVSGVEGQEQGARRITKPLFPSEGHFSPVVPLSDTGEPEEEQDETTLVPARARRARRPAHATPATPKKGVEQSWAFIAVAVLLSALAGAAAGIYILRSQQPAEAYSPAPPAAGDVAAGAMHSTGPAAEPPVQPASEPTPQTNQDRLAAAPASAVPPVAPAPSPEADTKAERLEASARPQKVSPQAAEPPARRAAQPEPRAASPARAEPPPPRRITRANPAPRRPERESPATAAQPARPSLVSSPPPSAKPSKVIKWP